MNRTLLTGLVCTLTVMACRPQRGPAQYPEITPYIDTASPLLLGFTPYTPAVQRLSLGAFYEGEATEVVPIDSTTTHLYIYENTFSTSVSDDRVEGLQSTVGTVGNVGWWGGGIHWDSPRDVSNYNTLHLALKSSDPSAEALEVGMGGGGVEARVLVSDYGFVADGEWHAIRVPTADLVALGVDLASVGVAIQFIGSGENPGSETFIDDVYLTEAAP